MKNIATCLITLFILVSLFLTAQPHTDGFKYIDAESFTVNDGLSQGMINCIMQDHFGFMWLGTLDGLNRYDGYNVNVYRHNPDDTNSVSENYITCTFEDSKNRLWVGTNKSGLNLFDYKKENFIHFRHNKNNSNCLSDDRILCISEDAFGALWVGTKNGLNKIIIRNKDAPNINTNKSIADKEELTITPIKLNGANTEPFKFHETTSTQASFEPSFFIDFKGLIFVRTENDYYCIHPSSNFQDTIIHLEHLNIDAKEKDKLLNIISSTGLPCKITQYLYWLAKESVVNIDGVTGLVTLTKPSGEALKRWRSPNIVSEGTRWFTLDFQLYQYIEANEQVIKIKTTDTNKQVFVTHVKTLYKDRTGNIWVGSGGYGALKFNADNEKFHRVTSASVHLMYANAFNKVMIREGDFFYRLQKNLGGDTSNWQSNADFFKDVYYQLHGKYLASAAQDKNGVLWLHTPGIQKYDPDKKIIIDAVNRPITWPALYVDKQNTLWFADSARLCNLNATFKEKKYSIPYRETAPDFYVETILKDNRNVIWVGTTDGLFCLYENLQKWKQFFFDAKDKSSISSNLILSICEDADNRHLWIGTNGGGFNCFDKQTGKCKRFTVKNGLSNDVVYGILQDAKGTLWMSTNKGLSNFNPVTKQFQNYTVEDGLQSNEFNTHACCKATDGTMFFGGVNGYNYFNPVTINTHQPQSRILITDIKSNGISVDFNDNGSPLSLPLYLTKKVEFNFIHNTLSFEFSALNFKTSSHNKYLYKLQGIDKNWIYSSTNRSAVYSNLQPGRYTFYVKASNSSKDYSSLEIIILPPWYMTWWFTTLIVIFVTALLYSFYRYKLNNEIRFYKDHQRIASDLHDDIGASLSSIHIYSEVAMTKIYSRPQETKTYLKHISSNVENIIGSLDDIVWMLKQKSDRFEDIGNRMRAEAINICEASGYTLQLKFNDRLKEIKFGKETRKNLFLIYKEAINNAIKYAEGKIISINLSVVKDEIVLSVTDDGKGFNEKEKRNGNGLENMRKRARDLNGKLEIITGIGEGTTVVLKFTSRGARQVK